MTFIVHGATGAQGSPVLARLLSTGHQVRALARRPVDLPQGAVATAADMADTDALTRAYTGAAGMFCHLPVASPERLEVYAHSIGSAVAAAQPGRVVVSTSGQPVPDAAGSTADSTTDRARADNSPATATTALATLLHHLGSSGVPVTVLAPRLYLENLLLPGVLGPLRQQGVLRYPLPERFQVSWCSHLDVADAAVALLTRSEPLVGVVEVGHLPGLSGPELAEELGAGLGTTARYQEVTPAELARAVAPDLGEQAAASVQAFYQRLATEDGCTISASRSTERLLGLSPRPVASWVRETGA